MKQAIIDIGSNSMHLNVYDVNGNDFKILFNEKIMAGLAGYIDSGVLNTDGIEIACMGLSEFKERLECLGIDNVNVFATAALRNIANTEEAVKAINAATGYDVEVLGSDEEALLGYYGAMYELNATGGAFVDIGGGSTEIVIFEDGEILKVASYPMGSLNLYKKCVKNILPGKGSVKRINEEIDYQIEKNDKFEFEKVKNMFCVGGTARTILKIIKKLYDMPKDTITVTAEQVNNLFEVLSERDRYAVNIILKSAPDRVHTIVPGLLIIKHMMELFDAEEMTVSKYGVREGYLCKKISSGIRNVTNTPKTEN